MPDHDPSGVRDVGLCNALDLNAYVEIERCLRRRKPVHRADDPIGCVGALRVVLPELAIRRPVAPVSNVFEVRWA